MEIKHKYSFNDSNKRIIKFLNNKNIKVSPSFNLITIEVFENESYWHELKKMMIEENVMPLTEIIYSKKEILEAEWLRIRSKWRWEYPQPENNFEYKKITYDNSKYCDECGSGLIQKSDFFLKKEPTWGNKQMLQLNWVEDELFINSNIISVIEKSNIKGLNFSSVKSIKNKTEFTNIKQIKVDTILEKALHFKEEDITKKIICTKCKNEKFVLSGSGILKIRRDSINKSLDIVKSYELFGDGKMAARMIFVSNKFAKLFFDNKWKDVSIKPIIIL